MPFHADMTGADVHLPITYTYADATARAAATGFVSADLGKFAWQTDDNSIWMLTAITPTWAAVGGSGGIPPALANASFLTRTAESSLSNESNLGALTTGLLKITVSAGTATPSTAAAATDYVAPATTISTTAPVTGGGDLSANRTIAVSTMTGDSGAGGARGVVPAPAAGDAAASKFLKADGTWAVPSGSGAPSDAHYVTTQAETGLSAEFNLGGLTTGMLKHTVSGSVSTPATATEGTDYYKPGGTDVAVADGGTGASTAAAGRANLGADAYDIASFVTGKPTASQVCCLFAAVRSVVLPASLTGSKVIAGTAATGSTAFDIQVNGVSKGTITFAASGTVATFTFASPVTLAAGDVLKIIAPGSQDATCADIGFTLAGTY